ncbi:MAG: penicillin-binding protein 2 [Armatimonadetes bacterium CG07_land_8_20_14_0_80_40_9]|nr:MAG: penicillin-binding protein 2 [Armatimonadetes bacterium CG07_land_8_20_14_0_80_40_9]
MAEKRFKHRLTILRGIAISIISVLIIGLGYLQVARGKYWEEVSRENRIRLVKSKPRRGILFDRKGRVLATNRQILVVSVIPGKLSSQRQTLKRLSKLLGLERKEIEEKLGEEEFNKYNPVKIKENIEMKTATRILESFDLPGVVVEMIPVRYYPQGKTASHTLGYVGEITKGKLEKMKSAGYKLKDIIGLDGIELYYDRDLRGEEGGSQIEVDALGHKVRVLGDREPRPGKNIVLTLDKDIQEAAERAMGNKVGAVVVMNPQNGEILALVSKPNFEPNFFLSKISKKDWSNLVHHPNKPLQNRAIANKYPPGSIFKIVTAAAALESGKTTATSEFFCSGKYRLGKGLFRCWQRAGHGKINLVQGLAQSCDIVFYQLGRELGIKELGEFAELFGLGSPTGIDLPGEVAGRVPTKMWKKSFRGERWYGGDTINMSVGQGFLQVTPLQMAVMTSIIANGGKRVKPHLLKTMTLKREDLLLSKQTIDVIKEGMIKSVAEAKGTAHSAYLPGLSIAGKTGTAEDPPREEPHAWFVSFAPADNPKMVIVVFIEQGGKGGGVAAPIARKIYSSWLIADSPQSTR